MLEQAIAFLLFLLSSLCIFVAIIPRAAWRVLQRWRSRSPDAVEPSGAVVAGSVVSGVIGALLLAGTAIWLLATEDRRDCEQIMSQLEDGVVGVDFEDLEIEEISDYSGARWDLERAAAELDVELEMRGSSLEVVYEDGNRDVLGTLDEMGAHPRCEQL